MTYHRFEDYLEGPGVDEYERPLGPSQVRIRHQQFRVLRKTPCGVWINEGYRERFILTDARKHFACPTVEEAKASYIARKGRQIRILSGKLRKAKLALAMISKGVDGEFGLSFVDLWAAE